MALNLFGEMCHFVSILLNASETKLLEAYSVFYTRPMTRFRKKDKKGKMENKKPQKIGWVIKSEKFKVSLRNPAHKLFF